MIHDILRVDGIYFRLENIKEGILRTKQNLEKQNIDYKLVMDPK